MRIKGSELRRIIKEEIARIAIYEADDAEYDFSDKPMTVKASASGEVGKRDEEIRKDILKKNPSLAPIFNMSLDDILGDPEMEEKLKKVLSQSSS